MATLAMSVGMAARLASSETGTWRLRGQAQFVGITGGEACYLTCTGWPLAAARSAVFGSLIGN